MSSNSDIITVKGSQNIARPPLALFPRAASSLDHALEIDYIVTCSSTFCSFIFSGQKERVDVLVPMCYNAHGFVNGMRKHVHAYAKERFARLDRRKMQLAADVYISPDKRDLLVGVFLWRIIITGETSMTTLTTFLENG